MRTTLGLLILLAQAASAGANPAAQDAPKKRPRIGVVFSGGSALGLVHLGVVQWLEEHRIPIDAVAGTSMGGLMAGLYATGHTSAEMNDFIGTVDWGAALAYAPQFRQLSFRRKEDAREYPNLLEFGLKRGRLNLPSGLSPGHGVGLVLSRVAAPYSDLASFDDLPTPFRCVATDLNASEYVVFDKGNLFDALRATMSLPGLFAPVRSGNRLLVDGALLNNLPVNVMKAMKVDIVIAVALNTPPDTNAAVSLLSVAGKSIRTMIIDNERRNLGLADLVIMPELKGFTGTEYSRWEELKKRGYEGAEDKALMLEKLSLNEAEYSEYVRRRQARRRKEEIAPEFVDIAGAVAVRRREAMIRALSPERGKPLDRRNLEAELNKLVGMGRFETATYHYAKRDGKDGVEVTVAEKPQGPPFLKPAFLLGGDQQEGLRFGIGARLTFLDAGGPASEWRSDFSVGQYNNLASEYYYRLRGGKWFVAPRGGIVKTTLPLYEGKNRLLDYGVRKYGGAVDFGYAFGRFQEIRIGYGAGHISTKVATGPADLAVLKGRTSGVSARWAYEGQDQALIPQRGIRSTVTASWMTDYPGVRKQFPMFEGQLSWAHSVMPKTFLVSSLRAGATANEGALANIFPLGGLFQLTSLSRGQLFGTRYYNGGAYVLRSLSGEGLALFGRFYGTAGYEVGDAWFGKQSTNPYNSALVGISGETNIGVLFFGGGFGERGERKIIFRLGRFF